jgi:hypothetical protein
MDTENCAKILIGAWITLSNGMVLERKLAVPSRCKRVN